MFNRLLRVLGLLIGVLIFPLVMAYEIIECIFIIPIFWIVTGKKYGDYYDYACIIWVDLMDGDRKLKGFTLKTQYGKDFWNN